MHHPLTDIQADFEINRLVRYQITAKRNYLHRRTDGQTDGQTSHTTTIGSFFEKRKKKLKIDTLLMVSHKGHACQISAKSEQACQISQLCGRCMLYNHIDAVDHSLPDYVISVMGNNY